MKNTLRTVPAREDFTVQLWASFQPSLWLCTGFTPPTDLLTLAAAIPEAWEAISHQTETPILRLLVLLLDV
jgi:hypothetical protein